MSTLQAVIIVSVVVSAGTAVVTEAIAMWFFRRWVVRFLTLLAMQQKTSRRECGADCPMGRYKTLEPRYCFCGKVGDITK